MDRGRVGPPPPPSSSSCKQGRKDANHARIQGGRRSEGTCHATWTTIRKTNGRRMYTMERRRNKRKRNGAGTPCQPHPRTKGSERIVVVDRKRGKHTHPTWPGRDTIVEFPWSCHHQGKGDARNPRMHVISSHVFSQAIATHASNPSQAYVDSQLESATARSMDVFRVRQVACNRSDVSAWSSSHTPSYRALQHRPSPRNLHRSVDLHTRVFGPLVFVAYPSIGPLVRCMFHPITSMATIHARMRACCDGCFPSDLSHGLT